MVREVEFFFDYGSPFSYLADSQLKGLAERTGARVIYRPMLLGGVFKETGNSSPISIEAKRKYSNIDLERWAKHYGVPKVYDSYFRRVDFDPESGRGGLLGQASLLTVTSYADRTSPVIRGKWVLTNIVGSPPPPPRSARSNRPPRSWSCVGA